MSYTSVGWLVLGPSHFSQDVVFNGGSFLPVQVLFAATFGGVRAKNEKEAATHTHGQLATRS